MKKKQAQENAKAPFGFIILLILVFHLAENSDFYEATTEKKYDRKECRVVKRNRNMTFSSCE
jgi:hypothetical protein